MTDRTNTRLLLTLLASALLLSVQAGKALPERTQGLSTAGFSGVAAVPLSPTLHPIVPETLAVPASELSLSAFSVREISVFALIVTASLCALEIVESESVALKTPAAIEARRVI